MTDNKHPVLTPQFCTTKTATAWWLTCLEVLPDIPSSFKKSITKVGIKHHRGKNLDTISYQKERHMAAGCASGLLLSGTTWRLSLYLSSRQIYPRHWSSAARGELLDGRPAQTCARHKLSLVQSPNIPSPCPSYPHPLTPNATSTTRQTYFFLRPLHYFYMEKEGRHIGWRLVSGHMEGVWIL